MKLRPLVFLALLLTALVAGCATDATTAEKAAKEKDEYVTVVTTGSNIPKRVKKSDIVNGTVAKGTLADSVDKDEFARAQRPSSGTPSGK